MQSDITPSSEAGARSAGSTTPPARAVLPASAGAGLVDHRRRDPFPRAAGSVAGLVSLVLAIGVVGMLWLLNPAFASGTAMGTSDQIGKLGGGPPPDLTVAPGSPQADGKALIGAKGCGGCHTIPGIAAAKGTIGPNLGGVANRKTLAGGAVQNAGPDSIKTWILCPPCNKPGTLMPNLGLTDDEAAKIVSYLELLQ